MLLPILPRASAAGLLFMKWGTARREQPGITDPTLEKFRRKCKSSTPGLSGQEHSADVHMQPLAQ